MAAPQTAMVQPAPRGMRGHVRPPGDKAISHRYALLAALADGRSDIRGYSTGGDCASTVRCLRALGVTIEETGRDTSGLQLSITGRGLGGLQPPTGLLDAGNSGSTMRMLAGILSAHPFATTMTGDDSLQRRPMRRVIVPLERMGARIGSQDGRPPLSIQGTQRPGQNRSSSGRFARKRDHDGARAPGHAGSYGAGVARVRCAGRGQRTFCLCEGGPTTHRPGTGGAG